MLTPYWKQQVPLKSLEPLEIDSFSGGDHDSTSPNSFPMQVAIPTQHSGPSSLYTLESFYKLMVLSVEIKFHNLITKNWETDSSLFYKAPLPASIELRKVT